MRLRVILLLLAVCVTAGAQQRPARKAAPAPKPAEAPKAWPIETITITGNEVYSREQILAVAGIHPGDKVTRADIEAARDRLAASGAFDRIEFRFGPAPGARGYAIDFTVSEAGPFYPVRFEDLGIPPSEAQEVLKRADPLFGDRIPPTRARIDRCAEALSAATNRKVVGSVTPDDAGELAIIFRPEGSQPIIARVVFKGSQALHESMLQNAINSVAVGRAFRESRFRMMLDGTVRPLYEARGRAGVTFPKIETSPEEGVDGVLVTVTVEEGELFTLGEVSLEGIEDTAPLIKAAALRTGDLFNMDEVRSAAGRIEKALRRDGYMGVTSDVSKRIDLEARRVDVTIRVTPGPQYRFGRLRIEGLDVTTEPAIRKLWGMKPGQTFNADYPTFFLERIREEEYFDNLGKTDSKLDVDETGRTVDVTLIFGAAAPEETR
ncbi:MAG: FtsQ-type POTRA domain-containing protein [bacterium]|jgi:outer membrane protein insertion porin family